MARPRVLPFSFVSDGCAPGGTTRKHFGEDRAGLDMCTRQIAEAHQELADDLAAGEHEGLAEQLDPGLLRQRMVLIEPGCERAMRRAQGNDPPRILDRRPHLETVAD